MLVILGYGGKICWNIEIGLFQLGLTLSIQISWNET
jgi:hypothetical protein